MEKIEQNFQKSVYSMMVAIGVCHLINDSMQAVIPAIFPLLKQDLGLTFTQLGLISFVLNLFSSILQPVVGYVTDKKPMPYALPVGMISSFIGLTCVILADSYTLLLVSVLFLGFGSAIFHPEGSRVSFLAAGNKRGLSQSIYQVGGNSGQALAPILSAFLILPYGIKAAAVVLVGTTVGIFILTRVASWYKKQLEKERLTNVKKVLISSLPPLTKKQIGIALTILFSIIFARSFYTTNMTSFYVFYLMDEYDVTSRMGQIYIFLFMACGVIGTFFGGPLSDRIGRKNVILLSVVVPIPFCLLLPHMPLPIVPLFLIMIGTLIMISFSVTVVYAQELVPSKIGTMAGLTVGLSFGMGAIASVLIGKILDETSLAFTMNLIAILTLLLLVAFFLPKDAPIKKKQPSN